MMVYLLWILAFLLKVIGAAWDTSYHFAHLRETFQISHDVNLLGDALLVAVLIWCTRTGRAIDRRSRWIAWTGVITTAVAAPLDELYHQLYGIDLTTWSPTHLLLAEGSLLMIAGVTAGYLKQFRAEQQRPWYRLGLLTLLWFAMEDILFPLGQQEYGAVVAWLAQHGRWVADADLMALVHDPVAQAFGGVSPWLYPVYLIWGYAFCTALGRRLLGWRFGATVVAAFYLVYRGSAWLILGAVRYPQSFVPYFMLVAALAVDLLGAVPRLWQRLALQAVGLTAVAYVGAALWARIPAIMPPWPLASAWLAAPLALVGLWLGEYAGGLLAADVDTRAVRHLAPAADLLQR